MMVFNLTPDVSFKLRDHVQHTIIRATPKQGFDFRSDLTSNLVYRRLHSEFDIHKTPQEFEVIAFPMDRMDDFYMFFVGIEGNTITATPRMNLGPSLSHVLEDFGIVTSPVEALGHREIARKQSLLSAVSERWPRHVVKESVPEGGPWNSTLEDGVD